MLLSQLRLAKPRGRPRASEGSRGPPIALTRGHAGFGPSPGRGAAGGDKSLAQAGEEYKGEHINTAERNKRADTAKKDVNVGNTYNNASRQGRLVGTRTRKLKRSCLTPGVACRDWYPKVEAPIIPTVVLHVRGDVSGLEPES